MKFIARNQLNHYISSVIQFLYFIGKQELAESYLEKYRNRVEAIEKILWNDKDGTYYDFVMSQTSHNRCEFVLFLDCIPYVFGCPRSMP